ncbi:uncharacterized protein LOC135388196 isoform X2 [Ornithodoros turicata]|uniref:uncharacterized protein LOC135388196 isoform X2 n=1 Tax=Ornithodoros turicata TaxID=34597 RepID=UPI003139EDBF
MDNHQRQESRRPDRGQLSHGAAPKVCVDEKSTDSGNPPESDTPFLKVTMVGGCILLVTVIVLVSSREEEVRRNGTKEHIASTPVYMHHNEAGRNVENIANQLVTPVGPSSSPQPQVHTLHKEESRASRALIDRIIVEAKPRLSVLRPEGARPLLCVLSPEAKHPLQFPKKHCTHLVYSDVKYDLHNATFTPVSDATYAVLQTLKGTTSLRLLVNMAERTLRDLAPDRESKRFSDAVSSWLTSTGLNGVAFLGQSLQSPMIGTFVPTLRLLRSVLGPLKLDIVIGITVQDWDAQPTLIARRMDAIGEHADYLILETHYRGVMNGTCRTAYPSVLYSDDPRNPSVPIAQALSWMTNINIHQKLKVNTCFSLTLGALLFRGAGSALASCRTSQLVSYMKVCKDSQWTLGTTAHVDVLAEERLGNGQVESHEGVALLAAKVSRAISMFPLSCVAAYQVDLDDYEGECGKPFERLQLVRQAQEKAIADDGHPLPAAAIPPLHETVKGSAPLGSTDSERRQRCMAPGKEFARPLICVFSDRITVPRNFTRQHCTHIVLSLRRYRRPDSMRNISAHVFQRLKSPDIKVLVALHEDLLLSANAEELAESSSVLLRGTEVDGLAFLYISQSASQLRELNIKLQALHSTLKSSGLCLLLSLQLAGYIAQPRIVDKTLRDVSKNVDVLVVNSHYPGSSGVCRAVHASVFKQSLDTCVPTVAVETALSWFKFIASTSIYIPFLCFSVDLRVFRYVGKLSQGTCGSEEQLHYYKVCAETGWSTVYEVTTDSVMRRKEANLETFDTATSLRKKVEAAIAQYPKACVAAYNYDFEDVVGHCKDQRLSSVRSALDQTASSASQTLQPPKESISVRGDQSGVSDKPLVCVLSKATLTKPFVPQAECTHLVHREAWYDALGGTIHVKESSLGLIANRPNMKHVAGLSGEIFLSAILGDRAVVQEMASNMAISARRMHLDGLAILDFNRTSRTIASFAPALSILRKAFSQDLIIILGLEVLDASLPTKTMARRLLNTIKLADITIFQTHYRSVRGYCQVSYPSVYEYKEGNLLPLATALDWMRDLGVPRICVSFNMAVLEFDRINSTNDCKKVLSRSYSETCNNTGWKRDDETSESFSAVREKGSAWQTFESAELLGRKVDRMFAQHPGACVAAFNIDLEDATPTCEKHGRFARLSTIAEKYVTSQANANLEYETLPQIAEDTASIMSTELVGSHALSNHDTQNQRKGDHTEYQYRTSDTSSRPFVCFMGRLWAGPAKLPPSQCTHVVLRVKSGGEEVMKQLKEQLNSAVKYLAAQSLNSRKNRLAFVPGYFDGVAVINIRTYSTALTAVGDSLASFRNRLPKGNVLAVGLEIMDFHQDAGLIVQQLGHIQMLADIIIFQTHFRRDRSFCRTAYPSMYHSANDTCIQTPPITKVVKWMQLLYSPSLCISFNLAALRFHLTESPGVGELCQNVEEVNDLCYTEEWKTSDEEQYAMATSRHQADIWFSYETGRLLRQKISKALSAYPRLCLAAFSVDADGSSKCRKEAYSRVNDMATAALPKVKPPIVQKANVAPKRKTLSKPNKIVCVLNGGDNMGDIPHQFCDYYIYGYAGYVKDLMHILPDAVSLESIRQIRRPGVKIVAAIWQEDFRAFLEDMFNQTSGPSLFSKLIGWLFEYNLDGLATAYYNMTSSDLERAVTLIHDLGCKLHASGYELVVGITITDLDAAPESKLLPSLRVIARSVDLLTLETHVGFQYLEDCRIHFPSRMGLTHPYVANSPTISKASYYIERLAEITDVPVCFSLSLGVRYYELENAASGKPGFECNLFQYLNYSDVCNQGSLWSPPVRNSDVGSTWHWTRGAVYTYETPPDIVMKVLHVRSKCVALYEVELDDPYAVCTKGRKFPRLQDIYQSYESIALLREEPKKIIAPSEPTLICVVTDKFPTIYPPCDYVVYYGVEYVGGEIGFEDTSSNVALIRFLGRTGNEHRFISPIAKIYSWYRDMDAKAEAKREFVRSTTKFLLKHALKGIALLHLEIYSDNAGELWRFLESIKCQLSYNGHMVMVGIRLKSDASEHFMSDLNHLTRSVNIFILETHLEVPANITNCTGRYPSTMRGQFASAGTIPIELGVEWLKALRKPQPFLCYSVSMAAFEFHRSSHSAPVGAHCNDMTTVDYSEVCKRSDVPVQSSYLAISTFQRVRNKLYTYDTKSDLVLKVDTAGTPCVAAYHADYDDPQGVCGAPHLRTALINESLYELAKTHRLNRAEDVGRRAEKPVGPQHAVICVFHENATSIGRIPSSVCDYIVLDAFVVEDGLVEKAQASIMQEVRQLSKESSTNFAMMLDGDGLSRRWKAGRRIYSQIQEIISFMIENGFNAVAFGFTKTLHEDFVAQTTILSKTREEMQKANHTEFEILMVVPFSIRWLIWSRGQIFGYIDAVIFITHNDSIDTSCTVKVSSSYEVDNFTISSVTEAALLMEHLSKSNRSIPLLCFTVSLAALMFNGTRSDAYVGDDCRVMSHVAYETTCPLSLEESTASDTVAAYMIGQRYMFTYENEDTVAMKAIGMSGFLPKVCIATYSTELEDLNGNCFARPPASRLRAIKYSLTIPEHTAFRYRIKNPLICTVGKSPKIPVPFPADYCDILIYTEVMYDQAHQVVRPTHNLSQFNEFFEFYDDSYYEFNRPKLAIALDPKSLEGREYQSKQGLEDIANVISSWLALTRTDGLAIINDVISEQTLLHHTTFMEKMRSISFKKNQNMILLYGASVIEGYTNWAKTDIASYVDVLILMAHRNTWALTPCVVGLPSTLRNRSEHSQKRLLQHSVRGLKNVVSVLPAFAVSINLAVRQFKSDFNAINDSCIFEKWVNFSRVCGSTVIPVGSFSGAIQNRDSITKNAFETDDSVRIKIRLYHEWVEGMGVVLFNADYEATGSPCPYVRGGYSRLITAYEQTSINKGKWDTPATAPPSHANITEVEPAARPDALSFNPMVCVFGKETTVIPKHFPKQMCDFIVLMALTYHGPESASIEVSKTDLLQKFLAIPNMDLHTTPYYLVGFYQESFSRHWIHNPTLYVHFANRVTVFMKETAPGVHGIFIEFGILIGDHAMNFQNIVQRTRNEMARIQHRNLFKVGMGAVFPLRPRKWDDISLLIHYLDVMVMVTHRTEVEVAGCRIVSPSTLSYEVYGLGLWSWSTSVMRAMINLAGKKHMPPMCFSMSMAVLKFEVAGHRVPFDGYCYDEDWVNYAETCPSFHAPTYMSASRLCGYSRIRNHVWTFENEDTVSIKTDSSAREYAGLCVAAYNVNYEDEGKCTQRRPYSRMRAIRKSLNHINSKVGNLFDPPRGAYYYDPLNPSPPPTSNRSLLHTYKYGEPSYKKKKRRRTSHSQRSSNDSRFPASTPKGPTPSVCYFNAPAPGMPCVAKRMCSHVIYDAPDYDSVHGVFSSTDGVWESAIAAARADSMDLFLGTKAKRLLNLYYQGCEILEDFLKAILDLATGAEGFLGVSVSILDKITDRDAEHFPDTIHKLRTSLDSMNMTAIFLVSPAAMNDAGLRALVADAADMIVYAGNVAARTRRRNQGARSSTKFPDGDSPTTMSSMDGLLELSEIFYDNSSVCVSLNLAVYNCTDNLCVKATYPDVCNLTGTIDPDYSAMTATVGSSVFIYDNEATLSSKLEYFRKQFSRSCVALLNADAEDHSYKCGTEEPFSRLARVRSILGGGDNTTSAQTTTQGTPPSQTTVTPTPSAETAPASKATLAPTGSTLTTTPSAETASASKATLAPTGSTVTTTPSAETASASKATLAPTGCTVTTTPSAETASASKATLAPTGSTVTTTPSAETASASKATLAPTGSTVTTTPSAETASASKATLAPTGSTVTTTPSAETASASKATLAPTGSTVTTTPSGETAPASKATLGSTESTAAPAETAEVPTDRPVTSTKYNATSTKSTASSSASGTPYSSIHNTTLLCLSGPTAKEDYLVHIPAKLCDYIVYPRGSYDYRKRIIHAAKPIGGHKAVLTLNSSTYVDDWVTDTPELVAFTNTLGTVMQTDQWTAFGIFLEDPNHTSNIVTVHAAILTLLMQKQPAPFQMVVGSVPLRDGRAFFGLLLGSDVFIMMTQHIPVKPCTIEPPTRTPALRAFIADQGHDDLVSLIHRWRVSNKLRALICAPISMAVVTYRLMYEEKKDTGDHCISQVPENYAQTCNKATTTDANAVYYSNATHLMAFENEETSLTRMQEYYNKIDDPCVAAFSVDCEDPTGLCGPAFSRLNAIRAQLDTYNVSTSGAAAGTVAPAPITTSARPETVATGSPTTASSESVMTNTTISSSNTSTVATASSEPPSHVTESSAGTGRDDTSSTASEVTTPSFVTTSSETVTTEMPPTSSSTSATQSPTPSSITGTTAPTTAPPNITKSRSATTATKNTLLCFMAPPLVLHSNFPELACDVIIYVAVCLKGNLDTRVNGSEWKAFLDLKEKLQKKTKKLKFAANLDTECLLNASNIDKALVKAVVVDAASMLVTYNLSAGAVVVQNSRHEPSIQWADVMQHYRTSIEREAADGILIFGASPTYLSNKVALEAILPLVDILVYTNHHTIVKDEPCRVSYPSGVFFEDQNNNSVETMKQHQDKVVCKSVSMAVFRFALTAINDTFGSACRQEVMDSYGEVCPPPRVGVPGEPTWYPIHYTDKFNLITYESEMTLQEKVLALRMLVNRVCVAAFHVEFEAPTGLCPHRSGFTRIKQMRNALDNPVEYVPPEIPGFDEGSTGTVTPTAEGHRRLAKEPGTEARLVCFVAPPVKTLQDYPSYSCDYLIYQTAGYDVASKHISLQDTTSWAEFLKLEKPPATRFMVSIDSQSLINITRVGVIESFVNRVPAWLQEHQFGGVAALFDSQDDSLRAYNALKALRERLDQFQQGTYVLLLGAAEALPDHLVRLAHTFVFVTNHVPSAISCKVSYPSVTTHMSTLSETLLLAKSLKKVAANVSVCISINLAVLVFWQEKVDRTVGAMCKQGAETDFAELCRQAEVKITVDREWMSAYLQADENNTLYTFETEDLLATKVAFFKSWFPDVCVAAFHTERDVYAHPCPLLPPFSRLIKIADTLYRNIPNLLLNK